MPESADRLATPGDPREWTRLSSNHSPHRPEMARIPHDPAAWYGEHLHAVIFASRRTFLHEFYALAVDAFSHDADEYGRARHRLLGVDAGWLRPDGTIDRGVLLDAGRSRLIEVDLATPVSPDTAQFLCLGHREQSRHRMLAARCTCPLVNPWPHSALADDKASTLHGWAGMGLEIPAFSRVETGDWNAVERFTARFGEAVLKPNGGTEGRDVVYLSVRDPARADPLAQTLQEAPQIRPAAIIQQRRDGVLFRDPAQGSLHTLVLRLNVAFDGDRYRLGSGFAQVGRDAVRPAACGHGGTILPLAKVLPNLVSRRDASRRIARPDSAWWLNLTEQCERAAALFAPLRLIGLDVLLDQPDGDEILAVFLEANPRPAGLCRSQLLAGLPEDADEPGISAALWRGLAALGTEASASSPRGVAA